MTRLGTSDLRNPFGFKLVSDRPTPIPNSDGLIQVGLAYNAGAYYAAATNPATRKCYILRVEINQQNPKQDYIYKEIDDDTEWKAAQIFFSKVGVFEFFYNGRNWVFPRRPSPDRKTGTDIIPAWFKSKFFRDGK